MKEWPKDEKRYVDFSDLMEPLEAAMEHCYKLTRKNKNKDFEYEGYNIGQRERACNVAPDECLKAEFLKWREEDQGEDAYKVILRLAFQLGAEQGRRLERDKR